MKKLGILTLVLAMMLSLCACGGGNNNDTTTTTAANTTQSTTSETATSPNRPEMDTTMSTNVPDPTVDSNSNNSILDGMDGTTDNTDSVGGSMSGGSNSGGASNGSGMNG